MTVFAIDSVGFSGTTSLTSILKSLPSTRVVHGTRNFKKETAIGVDDTSAEVFFGNMKDASQKYKTVAAIHFNMDPRLTQSCCRDFGIQHLGLVRRTEDQILSCFYWFSGKVLSGSVFDWRLIVGNSQEFFENNMLSQLGVPHNFSNLAYLFAMKHVIAYNAGLSFANAKIVQSEKLLTDEALFRETFAVDADIRIAHFDEDAIRSNSHAGKDGISEIIALPNIQRLNDTIVVNHMGEPVTVARLNEIMGYHG